MYMYIVQVHKTNKGVKMYKSCSKNEFNNLENGQKIRLSNDPRYSKNFHRKEGTLSITDKGVRIVFNNPVDAGGSMYIESLSILDNYSIEMEG